MLRFFLFLIWISNGSAQETLMRETLDPKTDTHVEVVALFSKASPGGYFPVRVKIANNLGSAQSIRLTFSSTVNYSNSARSTSEFAFAAAAGKTITREIDVTLPPTIDAFSAGGSLRIELSGTMGNAETRTEPLANAESAVLLSEELFTLNGSSLDAARSSRRSEPFAAKFNPGMLPDRWISYSGYDSIIMTDRDWTGAPAGAKNAIQSWVRLGGQLVIFSTTSADLKSLGIPDDVSYGSTIIKRIGSDLKMDAVATLALVSTDNINKSRNSALRDDFSSGWPLQARFGSQVFRYGLFVAVLIMFAITVGPVNLFVFAKSGERHKLFITTPIISFVTSLILIALIIIQDGFGGSGIRRVLMEVRPDGDQNAAYLHQEQFCRTGVLIKSRFKIETGTLFTPVPIAESRWSRFTVRSNNDAKFNLQPADSQLVASGAWFQSRSEHGHSLTAIISTRGRIEKTDNADSLLSTFDFPIQTLFYLDENLQWFRAEGISPGKSFKLIPTNYSSIENAIAVQEREFSDRNSKILSRVHDRPGCYIALTHDAPGIDTHPSIRWKETQTVITGPVITQ